MIRFFANANYDFIGYRKIAYGVTGALFALTLVAMVGLGFDYSIEFTGGTLVQVQAQPGANVGAIRGALDASGISGAEIQTTGTPGEFLIRARTAKAGSDADNTQATASAVGGALDQVLGSGTYTIRKTYAVGPKVGGELRSKALLAIVYSFLAVLAYLAYRLVPLTGALESGPFTAAERAGRLGRLLAAYRSAATPAALVSTAVLRLQALADFSDAAAAELGNPELARHAGGYRVDADRLARGRLR